MKKNNLMKLTGSLLLTFFTLGYSFAQTTTPPTQPNAVSPHNVGVSSTHTYDVAYTERGGVPNVYTWTIFKSDASYVPGAGAVAGVDYNITAGGTNALQDINWLASGYYVVRLQETNPIAFGSCAGALQTMNIFVSPTGTIQFSSATGIDQCPIAGAYAPALSYTGTISYPITVDVEYSINGSLSTETISVADATAALDILAVIGFTNNTTTTDDMTRSVTITGAKDSFGGDLTVGATNAHAFAVWSKPATTTIRHD